jgi:polysaccharide biosynthesis protein PslG
MTPAARASARKRGSLRSESGARRRRAFGATIGDEASRSAGRRRALYATAGVLVIAAAVAAIVAANNGGTRQSRHSMGTPSSVPLGFPRGPIGPPTHTGFGAAVNTLFNDTTYRPRLIDAQLSALTATGVTLARSDALWEATELAPPVGGIHDYNWTFDDRVATALAAHGFDWLPIVDYSAPWAASLPGNEHSPPRSDRDFAAFAGSLAGRYGRGGSFWRAHPELEARPPTTYEIWNEPDGATFWLPRADPARYAGLYASARTAIKAADPAARVIVGGLGHPRTFLSGMLRARPELRREIDGVALHPYSPTPDDVLRAVVAGRQAMDGLGLAQVPLYVTEIGWSTSTSADGKYAPAHLRPGYLETLFTTFGHTNCGIAAAILYAWMTPERNPAEGNDWLGIHPPAGGNTQDVRAFTAGVRAARSPGPSVNICS